MTVFEFDKHEIWEPLFSDWMREIAPVDSLQAAAQPQEYQEDARNIFLNAIGKSRLTDFLNAKLERHSVKVFHGTRVSDPALAAIRQEGLKPLDLASRKATLVAELQRHPHWLAHQHRLDAILHKYGPGWERGGAGKREDGGVHVCLSRNGLVKGCNHYLTHGAEVDNHITRDLFSDDSGLALLEKARKPMLISFDLTFPEAEAAANPYNVRYEKFPFITERFFNAWAFRLSTPRWAPAQAWDSIALRVRGVVAPNRLTIEPICDAELKS
jgi:hypothetical protein